MTRDASRLRPQHLERICLRLIIPITTDAQLIANEKYTRNSCRSIYSSMTSSAALHVLALMLAWQYEPPLTFSAPHDFMYSNVTLFSRLFDPKATTCISSRGL